VTCKGEIKLDKLVVPTDKYTAFRDALTKLQLTSAASSS